MKPTPAAYKQLSDRLRNERAKPAKLRNQQICNNLRNRLKRMRKKYKINP